MFHEYHKLFQLINHPQNTINHNFEVIFEHKLWLIHIINLLLNVINQIVVDFCCQIYGL